MKTFVKLVLVATVLGFTLALIPSEKNVRVLTEDQKKVAELLKQNGYKDIIPGERVPSTDGALVMRFTAIGPKAQKVNGTIVQLREHVRIYTV